jgi:hypothetical protein
MHGIFFYGCLQDIQQILCTLVYIYFYLVKFLVNSIELI